MAILPIRIYPDPVLRERCPAVTAFGPDLERLASDMVETMHAAPGVGLAAPQVGVRLRLAVVDLSVGKEPEQLRMLVNPEVFDPEGSEVEVEGCLSLPGFTEKVERPARVRVRALDLAGKPFELMAEGWLARAVCHEVDHLDGILFTDRVSPLKRKMLLKKWQKVKPTSTV